MDHILCIDCKAFNIEIFKLIKKLETKDSQKYVSECLLVSINAKRLEHFF